MATLPVPEAAEALPQPVIVSSNGRCVAMTWELEGGQEASFLTGLGSDVQVSLPAAAIGGWVESAMDD